MRKEKDATSLSDASPIDDYPRLSIWTIRAVWVGWFYTLFAIQAGPLIFALWWSENTSGAHDNIASTITAVASGSAPLIFVAAVATIIELEAVMVLKRLLEREAREKTEERIRSAYEKGRQDERQEGYKEGLEEGIERGRQLEREEQAARRNGDNHNGNQ